eukprot:12353379-Ditylum_brightwellii.AAC.1
MVLTNNCLQSIKQLVKIFNEAFSTNQKETTIESILHPPLRVDRAEIIAHAPPTSPCTAPSTPFPSLMHTPLWMPTLDGMQPVPDVPLPRIVNPITTTSTTNYKQPSTVPTHCYPTRSKPHIIPPDEPDTSPLQDPQEKCTHIQSHHIIPLDRINFLAEKTLPCNSAALYHIQKLVRQ